VAKVGTSKAGGTISEKDVVHPWLAAGAQQTNSYSLLILMKLGISQRFFDKYSNTKFH
jgi:hypothetical protein